MNDYTDLIARLRDSINDTKLWRLKKNCCDAADAIEALVAERDQLRKELTAALKDAERYRAKLQSVRDSLKFAANSKGGLVADIDAAMAQEKRDERD